MVRARVLGGGNSAMAAGGEVERLAAELSEAGAGDEEEWLYGGTLLIRCFLTLSSPPLSLCGNSCARRPHPG